MLSRRYKEYFSFTRKERKGIIILVTIVLIIVITRYFLLNQSKTELNLENTDFAAKVKSFEESLVLKDVTPKYKDFEKPREQAWKVPEKFFNFDPNTTTDEEFISLGFSQNQVKTILNYRSRGGRFYKNSDLLKIYGIPQEQYDILEKYIVINNIQKNEKYNSAQHKNEMQFQIKNIEINSASDSELVFLKGIGKTYANKISKYRNRLGGFIKKEQLMEITGMDTTRYNQFINQITIDTSLIVKLKINSVEYKELIKHPYLNKYQVQAILKYRELNGNFNFIDELVENNLIPIDVYIKIKPYLEL